MMICLLVQLHGTLTARQKETGKKIEIPGTIESSVTVNDKHTNPQYPNNKKMIKMKKRGNITDSISGLRDGSVSSCLSHFGRDVQLDCFDEPVDGLFTVSRVLKQQGSDVFLFSSEKIEVTVMSVAVTDLREVRGEQKERWPDTPPSSTSESFLTAAVKHERRVGISGCLLPKTI